MLQSCIWHDAYLMFQQPLDINLVAGCGRARLRAFSAEMGANTQAGQQEGRSASNRPPHSSVIKSSNIGPGYVTGKQLFLSPNQPGNVTGNK